MKPLTERQRDLLYRLSQVPDGHALHVNGHARNVCLTLSKRGLAKFLGNDKWTGSFFEITSDGRLVAEAR